MENPLILQTFYWEMNTGQYAEDFPEEKDLWNLLASRAEEIKSADFDFLWLPPANKGAAGINDVGYGTYDLWDLGEFEQKGSRRTKYGNKEELEKAVEVLHDNDLKLLYDAVLNHRLGADKKENVLLQDGEEAEVWTKFTFPGRGDKYSELTLSWEMFDGVDWDDRTRRAGEYLFETKEWDEAYDEDYLMGADIDYENPLIQEDVKDWGKWIINEIDFDGFRFDASKHVDNGFLHEFIEEVNNDTEKELFFIGEAWENDAESLVNYLDVVNQEKMHVFDFPLRVSFTEMVKGDLDMRWLGEKGLINQNGYSSRAVTFVENHDTERDGVNEYGTEPILQRKLQAYCFILMRREGVPTIFWKDYYVHGLKEQIDNLIEARKKFAYGDSYESEENDECTYSYIRTGDEEHPGSGLVMMITQHNSEEIIEKRINTGSANSVYYDYTGNLDAKIETDENGEATFQVKGTAAEGFSVWVKE